ncbi:MAG: hypothetical protein ABI409_10095 [Ramlibacter sp.]
MAANASGASATRQLALLQAIAARHFKLACNLRLQWRRVLALLSKNSAECFGNEALSLK